MILQCGRKGVYVFVEGKARYHQCDRRAFDASPSALQYLDRNYEPSGDLRIPMLMLSISRDPEVPRLHPLAYLNAVAATGSSDLLVEREINRYGHCNFTPDEPCAAFTDLVGWVELGIKPTPQDLVRPTQTSSIQPST
jgi:hypothetical protein